MLETGQPEKNYSGEHILIPLGQFMTQNSK